LFNETKEALDRQTATSEILRVISQSPTDVQPVFDTIAENAVRLCDGLFSSVFTFDGTLINFVAHNLNWTSEGREAFRRLYPRRPSRDTQVAQAILERAVVTLRDLLNDPGVSQWSIDLARSLGYRSNLVVPMLRDGSPIGAIGVARVEAGSFSAKQIALLRTFADQAVIAIENVRLFTETKEALDRQTATAEILRVISESPTNVQPVFDMIAMRATTLCDAELCIVQRLDGEQLHLAAIYGADPADVDVARKSFPMAVSTPTGAARAVRTRGVVHLADVLEDPTYALKEQARVMRFRSGLAVPMLREGHVIGVIVVMRTRPGYFAATQVELLQTFADQAVIAIENVRLFNELQEKNQALTHAHRQVTEALEQQTATSEILRVISSAHTDAQPVFDAIVFSGRRLCHAQNALSSASTGRC